MKKHFLTGLALLLPLIITIWIVGFVIDHLTKPFMGMMTSVLETLPLSYHRLRFLQSKEVLLYTSRILILVLLFVSTVALGWLTQWYLVHRMIRFGDRLLHRIPMVNRVYKPIQEVMTVLFSSKESTTKTPVLVPFPHAGCYMIGLAMQTLKAENSPLGTEAVSVLILGAPHPSISFILLYRADEVQPLDISVDEAVKIIVSCASLQTHLPLKEADEPGHPLLDR